MRLIDADELKDKLSKETNIKSLGLWLNLLQIIDNAPTVDYPFYQEAYQTGYEEGKNERPQGEWIPCYVNFTDGSKPLFAYCKCSLCNKQATGVYKFCPNCGADMRGDKE